MSLDWFSPVDIYLGHEILALQFRVKGKSIVHTQRGLSGMAALMAIGNLIPVKSRIRLQLSGALCPAFELKLPPISLTLPEKKVIAASTSSKLLGLPEEDVQCEFDDLRNGIAASLSKTMRSDLKEWGKSAGHSLISLKPMWSSATHIAAKQVPLAQGIQFQEPDGTTILAERVTGEFNVAHIAHGQNVPDALHSRVIQLLNHLGLDEQKLVKLHFNPEQVNARHLSAPTWPGHWFQNETH